MNIMITGGAGYIGSIATELLAARGHPAVVYDNLVKGHEAAIPKTVPFVNGNVGDGDKVRWTLRKYVVDAVMHFAAFSLVEESVSDPQKYFENNVENSLILAQVMVEERVRRIIFSSSAAVYGEPEEIPIRESSPTNPVNPYGMTKLRFEESLERFRREDDLQYVSLRYFNAAGATRERGEDHTPETHLIPLVAQTALGQREKIYVYGDDYATRDGTCIRDYIHVIDLAQAHILALNLPVNRSEIFNLGNGNGYTVMEVVKTFEDVIGREIPKETAPRRSGDPASLVASADKISADLGWKPRFPDLRDIVESAWAWHHAHPGGYET
jgi:UDP-glucose 4-epimerase